MRQFVLILVLSLTASALKAQVVGEYPEGDGSVYSSYRHQNLIKSTGHFGRLEAARFGGEISDLPYAGARLDWEYSTLNLDFHEYEQDDIDVRVRGRAEIGRVGVILPALENKLTFDLNMGISGSVNRTRMVYDLYLIAAPLECAEFGFFVSTRGEDLDIEGDILGELIPFSIHTDRNTSGFSGRLRLLTGLSIFGGYKDYQFDPDDISSRRDFGSLLLGNASWRHQGLMAGRPDGHYLLIEFGKFAGQGRLDLFANNTRFGQIARLESEVNQWKIEAGFPGSHDGLIKLERYSGRGELAGHVESWPFTESLVDLLGLRRNFKAKAQAVIWQAAGRYSLSLFGDINLTTELNIYRLYPELHWADWMPSYMVFGVEDMDHYFDKYDRIDFGGLNLELSRRIGRLELTCHISQLFPIRLKETRFDESEVKPPDSDTVGGGDSPRDDGGRTIFFRLGYII